MFSPTNLLEEIDNFLKFEILTSVHIESLYFSLILHS